MAQTFFPFMADLGASPPSEPEHKPRLVTVEKDTPDEKPPTPTTGNPKLAARFRQMADKLQEEIDRRYNSMSGLNPTARRQRIMESQHIEAARLERVQKGLRVLADRHEIGAVPESLAALKSKKAIYDMLLYERFYEDVKKSLKVYATEEEYLAARSVLIELIDSYRNADDEQRQHAAQQREAEKLERDLALLDIPGYFPTPDGVIEIMLEQWSMAYDRDPTHVLDPSAGAGALIKAVADRFPGLKRIDAYEINHKLRNVLKKRYGDEQRIHLIGDDFLEAEHGPQGYNLILMNPPFGKGAELEHIRHAFEFLGAGNSVHGGLLISVAPTAVEYNSTKKYQAFREWLDEQGGWTVPLPEGSFLDSKRKTGVNTLLVVIQR